MKITKLGHCCLVVEVKGARILTDPGTYSTAQNSVTGIDIILITHEHHDHLHVDSLQQVLRNNPDAEIITNASVGKILSEKGIKFTLLTDGMSLTAKGILFEAFGRIHAEIYQEYNRVENTGYLLNESFFYPGDALTVPPKKVSGLALPVAGTWVKCQEVIDYALRLHPKACFPVHDGMIKPGFHAPFHNLPARILSEAGIKFIVPEEEKPFEL